MEPVVYTATFGGYDRAPDSPRCNALHVLFTDDPIMRLAGWRTYRVNRRFDDAQKEARWYKLHATSLFPATGWTVWHDSNITLRMPAADLEQYLDGVDVAVLKHPERDCVYQEAEAVIASLKAPEGQVREQVARYRTEGYPDHNGLPETGILLRRHTDTVRNLEAAWWTELARYTLRDQLSFPVVAWRLYLRYGMIPRAQRDAVMGWRPHGM